MDLVKKLKCEKKLEDLLDKNYATSDDSESDDTPGCVGNECHQTDHRRQKLKRRPRHRWFYFMKPKKDGDIWDAGVVRNYRGSSDNDFAEVADDIRNPADETDVPTHSRDLRHRSINNQTIESEHYWKKKVMEELSTDERDLLAQSLFSHIWKTQGKETVSEIVNNFGSNNLSCKADDYFEKGCQLWAANHAEAAHLELERSRRIREVQSAQKSLLHIRYLPNDRNNKLVQESAESNAELYFALGMVQSARENLYASLREFRRAMQISAIGLGMEHELTKASLYMIRSTCLAMGQTGQDIQHSISLLMGDIKHEIEADKLYAKGMREQALIEYANLKLLYDSDSMVQARIITKMAIIFEDKRDYHKAMDLWTDLMLLYNETPSLGLHHPLARHALSKLVKARKQVQSWSEI